MEFAPEIFAFLIALAFVAGTVDAMAGGGGLLTLPPLMARGVPPVAALPTNNPQSTLRTGAAFLTLCCPAPASRPRFPRPPAGARATSRFAATAARRGRVLGEGVC